ncbi:SDR family NAD(P)-dependent oxidoreductase [Mangrovimicrobium sediminis]|uniref:SDR family NAD(P)-dependent oxidoreductase n=1 Tax=Mangrovimicrobium sediminis TaxID=2562682 RepID=UPI00198054C3|nr:SDR family oxidoreductase [Haliea sp. SAOS-164]
MSNPYAQLDLGGRTLLVTGGTGGLGSATARLCASRGAQVVIADLDADAGTALAKDIRADGGEAAFVRTDVTDEAQVKAMVAFAVDTFGGLHGAFNNAGIDNGHKTILEADLAHWQQNLAVNLTGVFLCLKYEIEHMIATGTSGAIVNTSSTAGAVGCANAVAYISAKHGVVGLTRSTAVDYSAKGIRVNAVLPGAVNTPMLEGALEDKAFAEMVARSHPIGRVGQAPEVAETVAWLLSDAAAFVTGACVSVDGGFTTQ